MASQTLKTLIFDIETVPDYARSDLWLASKAWPANAAEMSDEAREAFEKERDAHLGRMALQPEACQLVGLNVIVGSDGEAKSGWVGEMSPAGEVWTEEALLQLFWNWAAQCPRIVGFNILRFDLPVIYTRSALLGVQPTVALHACKPWEDRVIDLMQRRFEFSRDFMSLKALRRVLQLPVPEKYAEVLDNTGADVETLYLSFLADGGNDSEALRLLKLYGECDVHTTRELARLWQGYFMTRIE